MRGVWRELDWRKLVWREGDVQDEGQRTTSRRSNVRRDLPSSFDASSHARSVYRLSELLLRIPTSRSALDCMQSARTFATSREKNYNGFFPKTEIFCFCNAAVTCLSRHGDPHFFEIACIHLLSSRSSTRCSFSSGPLSRLSFHPAGPRPLDPPCCAGLNPAFFG